MCANGISRELFQRPQLVGSTDVQHQNTIVIQIAARNG